MSTAQRIIKNSIFLTTSQIFAKIMNFGLILVLTRFLTKDGFGLYSFSFAYVSIFFFMTHMGITNLLVRDIAKNKTGSDEYINHSLPVVTLFSLLFMLIVNVIPVLLEWQEHERYAILIFSFYFLFDALGRYFLAVMRAFERMGYEAVLFTCERILFIGIALVCWYAELQLLHLVSLFALVFFVKLVVSFIIVKKKFVRLSFTWSLKRFKPLLKDSLPFALIMLFATVSARIDLVLLKELIDTEAVATYNVARKIIEALSFIPENLYNAIFPSLSIYFIQRNEKYGKTFQQAFTAVAGLAFPLSATLFILAPKIINLLFESEYALAYIPLRWLSIGLLLLFIRQILSVTFNTSGKQHYFASILAIGMVVNIISNIVLIPEYNITGAAISLIISEMSIILISLPFVNRITNLGWSVFVMAKLSIAAISLVSIIYLIQDINLILIFFIVAITYLVLILILKIFTINELKNYIDLIFSKEKK
jgi:O-antigen/teichoic acid export membrane protein